jgi:hypothetical protein
MLRSPRSIWHKKSCPLFKIKRIKYLTKREYLLKIKIKNSVSRKTKPPSPHPSITFFEKK